MALLEEDLQVIYDLINERVNEVETKILQVDKHNLKFEIFDLEDYGLKEFDINGQRYRRLENCTLVKDIKKAFTSKSYIILKYFGNFWTLNSFQQFHQKYTFSFINICTDVEIDLTDGYSFPIIQFILVIEDLESDDVIIKRSNTIRLNDKILTDNSIYTPDTFPSVQEKMNEFGDKV